MGSQHDEVSEKVSETLIAVKDDKTKNNKQPELRTNLTPALKKKI